MIIQKDFSLSQILWYKIGGTAKYLLEIAGRNDLEEAILFLQEHHLYREKKYIIVGSGSNLIFTDNYYAGAIIHFVPNKDKKLSFAIEVFDDSLVTAFAGESFDDLIQFSFANNLVGLEWAGGLPGTVGAGVRGNVGAFGDEIKDTFYSAEIVKLGKDSIKYEETKKLSMNFAYRQSIIKQNKHLVVLYATFKLNKSGGQEVQKAKEVYTKNINYRRMHHPIEYPTCGSVFKNITEPEKVQKILTHWPDIKESVDTKWHGKVSMGYVINRLGFSNYKVGNMQVSLKHANFIVNLGGGKAKDVITIIKEIQNKVQENLDFIPEVEVEIIGD